MPTNYLAILVCGVAAMVVGFVWYGPLFGKAWMRMMGTDMMPEDQKAKMRSMMWAYYVIQFVLSLITAGVLNYHIMNWSGPDSALTIALCTWFGFVVTTEASACLWSGKELKVAFKMFLISAGAQLVTFALFGLILGYWK